jgi:uncharacterized protein (DUF1778 family)
MINGPAMIQSDKPKERQLRIRLKPADRAIFERAARLSDLTLSAWIRLSAREMASRQLANAGEPPSWT